MRVVWLICAMSIWSMSGASAHGRCDTFPTYADAVRHCNTSPLHVGKAFCGSHDRDKDGRPCECNEGGPKADENACKSKRKRKKS